MDNQTFFAKYGHLVPEQFRGGARAGVIVAAVLSALATLLVIFMNIAILPYYGTEPPLGVTHFLPLIAAALMVIMAGVAKPSGKIVLALPATAWLMNRIIVAGALFPVQLEAGAAPISLIGSVAALVYAVAVALLMWVCCASGKGGTACGVIVTVTAVLGFLVSFLGNFFALLSVIDYNRYMVVVLSANIFGDVASMLFYIANAAALFMIAKPKSAPYYYAPTQQPNYPQPQQPTYPQTTDNNTEVK